MTPRERVEAAMDTVERDEQEHPWTPETSVYDVVVEALGDVGRDYAEELARAVGYGILLQKKLWGDNAVALYMMFLTGVRLGKQLGIGEGVDFASLFSSTGTPDAPPDWLGETTGGDQ